MVQDVQDEINCGGWQESKKVRAPRKNRRKK